MVIHQLVQASLGAVCCDPDRGLTVSCIRLPETHVRDRFASERHHSPQQTL
jgi:hypothetical protein